MCIDRLVIATLSTIVVCVAIVQAGDVRSPVAEGLSTVGGAASTTALTMLTDCRLGGLISGGASRSLAIWDQWHQLRWRWRCSSADNTVTRRVHLVIGAPAAVTALATELHTGTVHERRPPVTKIAVLAAAAALARARVVITASQLGPRGSTLGGQHLLSLLSLPQHRSLGTNVQRTCPHDIRCVCAIPAGIAGYVSVLRPAQRT